MNTKSPKLHFSTNELSDRRARAVADMEIAGLDGLLMFRQESMYYLTGYDGIGFVFFQCLFLGLDGDIFLLTRQPDLLQAQHTSIVDDIYIWKDIDGADPTRDLKRLLVAKGLSGKTLGVERDSYGLTGANSRRLDETLKDLIELQDASLLVTRLRLVKSPTELGYVRRAGELADSARNEALRLARPGANEADILAAMQSAVLAGDGDYPACDFIVGSGPVAELVRYHSGRRVLDGDDQLTLEYAGVFRHYHAVAMQTVLIGQPHREAEPRHAACMEALLACEDNMRAGNLLADVFAAGALVLDRLGFGSDRFNAFGYSLGACFSPNWMDWPMIHQSNPVELRPGMVFFVHLVLPDRATGVVQTLGRTSIVTKKEPEPVCSRDLALIVN